MERIKNEKDIINLLVIKFMSVSSEKSGKRNHKINRKKDSLSRVGVEKVR